MEILIKKLYDNDENSIIYLVTESGTNVKAETVTNYKDEKEVIDEWIKEYDIIKVVDKRTNDVEYVNIDKENPLILVFYLDRDLMSNKDIIVPFSESVNNLIADRNINAIAFFLPTDDKERIECINPTILPENEMNRVNTIIEDLQKTFNIDE